MADALCGPSNALQTFQKHTTADRSLQHDRLAFRQTPSQSFRSSPGPGLARVEADFQAFQAGPSRSGPRLALSHEILRTESPIVPKPLPNWASEFQQLRIDERPVPQQLPTLPPYAQPVANPVSNWHQEFMRAGPTASFNSTAFQPYFGQPNAPLYSPQAAPYTQSHSIATASQSQLNGHLGGEQEQELFSKEFDLVQQEIDFSEQKGKQRDPTTETSPDPQVQSWQHILSHADMQMGDITGDYDYDAGATRAVEGTDMADQLRTLRRDGGWEALEAYERALIPEMERSNGLLSRDIVDNIKRLRQEEDVSKGMQDELLVSDQEHRAQPLSPRVRIGADAIPSSQQQAEPSGPDVEADELAKTAGQLLHNMREEQSTKFQNSSFMELMRQLRDREAHIEGENMIRQETHPGGKFYPSDAFESSVRDATP